MKEFDYCDGNGIVQCDACGCHNMLVIENIQCSEIECEMKDNGWLARQIGGNWYDFCSNSCFYRTFTELKKKI